MEDIIDIIVTETTNLIEITSQPTDEIIDVNIIDNREDVTLNVTPTVVEININSLTGNFGINWGEITGTLSNQTDLNTVLGLKADLVGGKVPSSQLPSYVDDVVEVANYASLPATGETGKIYITIDTNYIYRWTGSVYVEIKDSSAVWGAITGALSNQTDLQNALNAKEPTITAGTTAQYYRGDKTFQTLNTTAVAEATNLYYTDARARASVSGGTGISYNSTTGVITNTITQYTDALARAALSFTAGSGAYNSTTGVITIPTNTNQLTNGASFITLGSLSAGTGISYNNTTGVIASTITQYTDALARAAISLTVSGSSGASTYNSTTGVLNVPTYTLAGLGGQPALNGTGFVKISGTTISYDNSTYALDSAVVHNTGNESVAGLKTFTSGISADYLWIKEGTGLANPSGYAQLATDLTYFHFNNSNNTAFARFLYGSGQRTYTLPNSNGTVALTSDLHNAVTIGTANGLSLSTQVLSLGLASSTANGALSSTDWSTFNGKQNALSGTGFVKISGSTISYDNSTYLTTSSAASTYLPLSGGTLTGALNGTSGTFTGNVSTSAQLRIESSGNALLLIGSRTSGTVFEVYNSSNILRFYNGTVDALQIATGSGAVTLAGALSGTSATFNGTGYSVFQGSAYLQTPASTGLSFGYNRSGANGESTIVYGAPASGFNFEIASVTSGTITPRLTITNAGAATFSSSVQTTNIGINFAPQTDRLFVYNGSGTNTLITAQQDGTGDLIRLNGNGGANRFNVTQSGAATFSSSVSATSVALNGSIANSADAATLTIKQTSTSYNNGIYLERGGERNGYHMYIGGALDSLTFRRNYFGTQSDVMSLTRDGNVGIGTSSPTTYSLAGRHLELNDAGGGYAFIHSNTTNVKSFFATNESAGLSALFTFSNHPLTLGTNNTERMRITSGGNVLIGTTSDNGIKFQVSGDIYSTGYHYFKNTASTNNFAIYGSTNILFYNSAVGNIANINATTGIYMALSDKNKKKDFEESNIGLTEVMQLKPTLYRMKSESEDAEKQLGFIAQEVQGIIPSAYQQSGDFIGLNFNPIVAALTKAVQEQQVQIQELKEQLANK